MTFVLYTHCFSEPSLFVSFYKLLFVEQRRRCGSGFFVRKCNSKSLSAISIVEYALALCLVTHDNLRFLTLVSLTVNQIIKSIQLATAVEYNGAVVQESILFCLTVLEFKKYSLGNCSGVAYLQFWKLVMAATPPTPGPDMNDPPAKSNDIVDLTVVPDIPTPGPETNEPFVASEPQIYEDHGARRVDPPPGSPPSNGTNARAPEARLEPLWDFSSIRVAFPYVHDRTQRPLVVPPCKLASPCISGDPNWNINELRDFAPEDPLWETWRTAWWAWHGMPPLSAEELAQLNADEIRDLNTTWALSSRKDARARLTNVLWRPNSENCMLTRDPIDRVYPSWNAGDDIQGSLDCSVEPADVSGQNSGEPYSCLVRC